MIDRPIAAIGHLAIRPGAVVIAEDEPIGRVERLIVSPGTGEVTGLVVRKGVLLRRDIVIPIDAVDEAGEDEVHLGLTIEQLNQLPEFREEDYIDAPPDWQSPRGSSGQGVLFRLRQLLTGQDLRPAHAGQTSASAGGRLLRAGQRVMCRDGEVGRLVLVLLDELTRRVAYLVVERGRLLIRDTVVPVEWVADITRDQIYLDVRREQLDELPEYRPDEEITADVLDTLWYHADLTPADLQFVEVRMRGGVVELNGHTHSEEARAKIAAAAWRVRGVLGVRNNLDTFEAMEAAIRAAEESGRNTSH
jgi:uncharacterized protein YrrD